MGNFLAAQQTADQVEETVQQPVIPASGAPAIPIGAASEKP